MYKIKIILFFIYCQLGLAQSVQDIQRLKSEYEKMQNQTILSEPQKGLGADKLINNENPNRVIFTPYFEEETQDTINKFSNYFGYHFFTKRDTLGFWENLSIPDDYILGPGDEIIISLWGETSLRETFTISRSGKIYDEKVGVLNLSGKTIFKAEKYILSQFGRIYSTLNGKTPSTYLDLSLGALKSINVNFVGEVLYPGVYSIHPFSNVITGLIQAGGVDTTGSLRSILIKRNNKIFNQVDLYDYLLKGNISKNIQLKDNDIVFVGIRNSTISIDSSVFRPGIYESKDGESVKELIDFAGGPKSTSSGIIDIKRTIRFNRQIKSDVNYKNIYTYYDESGDVVAVDGDKITLHETLFNVQQVELIGQVKKPGIYNYFDGMTLHDLVEIGGGFDDSTFWNSVYQSQAEIIRRDPNSRYEKVVKYDLSKMDLKKDLKKIKLKNLDRFVVHSNLNFFEKKNIQINGEVNIPGSYPLITNSESLKDIINRAGGLTQKALTNGISIYRDKNYFENNQYEFIDKDKDENSNGKVRVAWQSEKIALMPGDSIIIKEKTGTINIVGEVYNPGLIEFKAGKSLRSYINYAGGITENGNRDGIIVVYANGVVVPNKWYNSPRILDGCTIIINKEEESIPINITQLASNWAQIVSSLITALVLTQQISSSN